MVSLWEKIRRWLIGRLGGVCKEDVPKIPVNKIKLLSPNTIRVFAEEKINNIALYRDDIKKIEELTIRHLAQQIIEDVIKNKLLNIVEFDQPWDGITVIRAELLVLKEERNEILYK